MGKLLQFAKRYSTVLVIIAALILGLVLAKILVLRPAVGIIDIKGQIFSSDAERIVNEIRRATEDRAIKAVVLNIDSPGGQAADIEEIYMNVLELRKSKPVIASVNRLAASGAYYVAVAANFIYAKPSSDVGGIGVISVLPEAVKIREDVVITGPFKELGIARRDYATKIQLVQESFLRAVGEQRGNRLLLSKEELGKSRLYVGIEALQVGLVDEIGSKSDAIEKAAQLARIANYKVIEISKKELIALFIRLSVNESMLQPSNTIPINYYVYMQQELQQEK